jgi:hypothetical protein
VKNGRSCKKGSIRGPSARRSLSVQDIVIRRFDVRHAVTSQNIGVCFFSNDCAVIRRRLYRPASLRWSACSVLPSRPDSHEPLQPSIGHRFGNNSFCSSPAFATNRPRIVPANLCSRILSDPTAWHACLVGASRTVIVATTILACLGRGHLVTTAGPHSRPKMKSNRMS